MRTTRKTHKKKRSASKRRQHGGRFLAEGTYGCVFGNEPLQCDTETEPLDNNYITKLLVANEAKKEYAQKKLLKQIDPEEEFLLYPHTLCKPKLPFKPSNMVKNCDQDKFINSEQNSYGREDGLIIKYKYGGKTFDNTKISLREFPNFLHGYLTLMKGVMTMHHNYKLYHCDIKPSNIVVKKEYGLFKIRLIDFGLSQHVEKDYAPEDFLTSDYAFWPFDTRFVFPIYNYYVNKFNHELESYVRTHTSTYLPIQLKNNNVKSFRLETDEHIKEYNLNRYEFLLSKTDIYSLGLALNMTLFKLFKIKVNEKNEILTDYKIDDKKTLSKLIRCLMPLYNMVGKMMSLRPQDRGELYENIISFELAYIKIKEVFSDVDFLRNLRAMLKPVIKEWVDVAIGDSLPSSPYKFSSLEV
jgi:serine/threonine protein kinase